MQCRWCLGWDTGPPVTKPMSNVLVQPIDLVVCQVGPETLDQTGAE